MNPAPPVKISTKAQFIKVHRSGKVPEYAHLVFFSSVFMILANCSCYLKYVNPDYDFCY